MRRTYGAAAAVGLILLLTGCATGGPAQSEAEEVAIPLASADSSATGSSPAETPPADPEPQASQVSYILNEERLAALRYLEARDWDQTQIQAERDAATGEFLANNAAMLGLDFAIDRDNSAEQVIAIKSALNNVQNSIIESGNTEGNISYALEGITVFQYVEASENSSEMNAEADAVVQNWLSGDVDRSVLKAEFAAGESYGRWIQYTSTLEGKTSIKWEEFKWSDSAGLWQNTASSESAPLDLGSLTNKWGTWVTPGN